MDVRNKLESDYPHTQYFTDPSLTRVHKLIAGLDTLIETGDVPEPKVQVDAPVVLE